MSVRYEVVVSDDAAALIEAALDTGDETLSLGVVPVDADDVTRDSFVAVESIDEGTPVK